MPKPNINSTVSQIKDYIRTNKLNHPRVKLSLTRPQLIAGLKLIDHWDDATAKTKKTRFKKSPPKPPFKIDKSKQSKQTQSDVVIDESKKPASNTMKIKPKPPPPPPPAVSKQLKKPPASTRQLNRIRQTQCNGAANNANSVITFLTKSKGKFKDDPSYKGKKDYMESIDMIKAELSQPVKFRLCTKKEQETMEKAMKLHDESKFNKPKK